MVHNREINNRERTTINHWGRGGRGGPAANFDHRRVAVANHGARFSRELNRFQRPWRDHYRWYHGSWGNWPSYPALWAGLGGGSWLTPLAVGSESFDYANPYSASLTNGDDYTTPPALDYSGPIEVPTQAQAEDDNDSLVQQAMEPFDQARADFRVGRYAEATTAVDRAILLLPGDRTMHEFRALCLFARQRYTEAAAVLYAVLVDGPGWDWDTMISFYPNVDVYTQQLRALEAYVQDHPDDSAAHFLLAYHYLVLNDSEAAIEELRTVVRLSPRDQLAAQIADALSQQPPPNEEEDEGP